MYSVILKVQRLSLELLFFCTMFTCKYTLHVKVVQAANQPLSQNIISQLAQNWRINIATWRVWLSSDCGICCVALEPADLKSFLKVELNLRQACSKDSEPKPPALLCCVLQALAIQGDLQHKIKLFSKSNTTPCEMCTTFIISYYLVCFQTFQTVTYN